MNKQFLIAAVVVAVMATAASAYAEDVKLGVIVGFTGPIESLTPDMSAAAELAMKEASASGLLSRWLNNYSCQGRFDLHRCRSCNDRGGTSCDRG